MGDILAGTGAAPEVLGRPPSVSVSTQLITHPHGQSSELGPKLSCETVSSTARRAVRDGHARVPNAYASSSLNGVAGAGGADCSREMVRSTLPLW
jgi:hypothetical protein